MRLSCASNNSTFLRSRIEASYAGVNAIYGQRHERFSQSYVLILKSLNLDDHYNIR